MTADHTHPLAGLEGSIYFPQGIECLGVDQQGCDLPAEVAMFESIAGERCVAVGIILDFSPENRTIPPGQGQRVARLMAKVDAGSAPGAEYAVKVRDGCGDQQVKNIFVVSEGASVRKVYPELCGGTVLADVADCNDNGIADDQDIATDSSLDTNTNGIPDECEPLQVALRVPFLERLDFELPAPDDPVPVRAELCCATTGKISGVPGRSTINGSEAAVSGKLGFDKKQQRWAYKVKLTTQNPKVTVSISGSIGSGLADCDASGSWGRLRLKGLEVVEEVMETPVASFMLLPEVEDNGKISGAGNLECPWSCQKNVDGKLKGKLSGDVLSWTFTAGKAKISFKGNREGREFVGILKLSLLPEKSTRSPFKVLAGLFEQAKDS